MAKVSQKPAVASDSLKPLSDTARKILDAVMREYNVSVQAGSPTIPRNEKVGRLIGVPGDARQLGVLFMDPKNECNILLCKALNDAAGDVVGGARRMWRTLEKAETVGEMDATEKKHLRSLWRGFGTPSEGVHSRQIQRAVNTALGEDDACPLSFATRLYRLGVFEREIEALNSNTPTPITLPQLRERLIAHEEQQTVRDGETVRPRGRPPSEISSHDLEKAASSTMKLLEVALPKFKDANVAMLASWLLTGAETTSHMTDWNKKPNRRGVYDKIRDALGGDLSQATTTILTDEYQGLMNHYLHKGAKTPLGALLMLLDEFGKLTDEQRLIIQLRMNRPLQLKRILEHYDPEASTPSYADVVFLSTGQTKAVLNDCEGKLAAAIDGGMTPQQLSSAFGVGARFAETLINRFSEGKERRGGDCGSDVNLFNITFIRTRRDPLQRRLDALTVSGLGERLGRETQILRGILPGKRTRSGRFTLGRLLKPLDEDTRTLIAACASDDYQKIGGLSDNVIADARRVLEEAPETTDAARSITIRMRGRSPQTRYVGDKNMQTVADIAEHARAEAAYWLPV